MKRTSLCYIEHEGCYLMLLRNKKASDPNKGKWIGIGGKFEEGETPDECMLREVREETGLKLTDYRFHGIIEFRSDEWEDEDMYLYTAGLPKPEISGRSQQRGINATEPEMPGCGDFPELTECDEGTLRWIPKAEVPELNLWEGDRIFLKELLDGRETINMRLSYSKDRLREARML